MEVLEQAWRAVGAPKPVACQRGGRCSRCGRVDVLAPTRTAVSKTFTAFDGWATPAGDGLCPACTWGYTTPDLRTAPHRVTQDGALARPRLLDLLAELAAGPLHPQLAVTVPLRPGRKHLLPEARWGHVGVDNAQLPWTTADATRLTAVTRLRSQGFGSRMLTLPAPPWPILRRHPAASWASTLDDWALLDPWRPNTPWLALALHLCI